MITKEKKSEIISKFGKNAKDTGAPEAQIAMFTDRITELTEHMREHKKDFGTQRSLLRLVGKRRRLLDYLKEKHLERYRTVIKDLNIRK